MPGWPLPAFSTASMASDAYGVDRAAVEVGPVESAHALLLLAHVLARPGARAPHRAGRSAQRAGRVSAVTLDPTHRAQRHARARCDRHDAVSSVSGERLGCRGARSARPTLRRHGLVLLGDREPRMSLRPAWPHAVRRRRRAVLAGRRWRARRSPAAGPPPASSDAEFDRTRAVPATRRATSCRELATRAGPLRLTNSGRRTASPRSSSASGPQARGARPPERGQPVRVAAVRPGCWPPRATACWPSTSPGSASSTRPKQKTYVEDIRTGRGLPARAGCDEGRGDGRLDGRHHERRRGARPSRRRSTG